MSAHEVTIVTRQLRERISALLSPDELALYDGYHHRLQAVGEQAARAPITPTVAEQAVLDKLEADSAAAALQKQLRVLLRIETLPQ